jgi:electron transport complex protein RnfB
VGLNKRMHTVITPHCTGCELCLPVCPVDCIQMENASGQATGWAAWSLPQAEHARARYRGRQARLQREACEAEQAVPVAPPQAPAEQDPKRAAIAAALARARAQRTGQG